MKPYTIAIIVIVTIGIISGAYYFGYKSGESKVKVEYLEKERLVHDTVKTKVIFWKEAPAQIDSFYSTDTLYKNIPLKFAYSDTLIAKDSSQIKVTYYFPPLNKFNVWADIKEKITYLPEIVEIVKPGTFWDRFGVSLQAGAGYGWLNKKVDIYTGVGFHFRID